MSATKNFCGGCNKNCCHDVSIPPMVFCADFELLVTGLGREKAEDSVAIKDGRRYLKRRPDHEEGCIFFDPDKRCTVYEYRPLDCRLFPFDVVEQEDGSFKLVVVHLCPRYMEIDQDMVDNALQIVRQLRDSGCLKSYAGTRLKEVGNGDFSYLPECFDSAI